jgi:hypothetical protein
MAEFKVRVRIDKRGQENNVSEVLHASGIAAAADGGNPAGMDRHDAVLNRRSIDWEDKARSK